MAKKPAKPARKTSAKAKPRKPARKPAGAKSRRPAKPVRKKAAPKKLARPKARKPTARPKAKAKPAKRKVAARKPAPKAKVAKPLPKAKARPATKPVAGHAKPGPKIVVKPAPVIPAAKGAKGVVAPLAVGHKPTVGEIAAKIAGKRAEDANRKKNGRHAEIAPRVLTPADVEARKRRLKSLIVLGKDRGFLTFAEINDHLPDDVLDAEQIEGIISMIGDMGIQVYDVAPDAETLLLSDAAPTAPAEDVEEAAEAAVSTLDSEFGRTTDPVRMYMREMGSVELLTREGEIAIAKRIEEGLKHMIMAISACPMTVAQILELAGKIEKDELKIDDLVDGLLDFNEELDALEDADDDIGRRKRRGRRRRDRRGEPRAPQGRGARALRDDPAPLRADAGRADQGRPQGASTSSCKKDLDGADADPLRRGRSSGFATRCAPRSKHPQIERKIQDPSEQGWHAAPGHQEVPGQRRACAGRPRGRRAPQ